MFKKIAIFMIAGLVSLGIAGAVTTTSSAIAPSTVFANNLDAAQDGVNQAGGDQTGNSVSLVTMIRTIVNIILFIVGLLSVVMIIFGGISFVVSAGDPAKTKKARDTILYSVVGLVVALLSFAIVTFVLDGLKAK